jgi:conjugal transfer pilus assembly protein TraW
VRALIALLALAVSTPATAADLGVFGETRPIIETDILETIAARLRAAERSGKVEALNRQFAARARKRIERPQHVAGLVRTQAPRSLLFDPSMVVPQDLKDHQGRVFARAGQRINPLERLPGFDRELIFLDGDDAAQVAFGLRRLRARGQARVYLVLVSGAPLELMRRHKVPLYFDQGGALTARLGIRQVPALVAREGSRLRISEVKP